MKLNPFLSQVLYFFDVLAFGIEGGVSGMLREKRPHRRVTKREVIRPSREDGFAGKLLLQINQKYMKHVNTWTQNNM